LPTKKNYDAFNIFSFKMSYSEDQIAEFQEVFMLFDTKGDGMIPVTIFNYFGNF
jgi:Ca2+-binding EF-hand superfamily protein